MASRCYRGTALRGRISNKGLLMKRTVMTGLGLAACAVVVLAAQRALAASPAADAIKGIEAMGSDPAKFKRFCDLMDQLNLVGGEGDEDDPEVQKGIASLIADMSPEYGAAMDVRKKLGESPESPDARAIDDAVDALIEKCPPMRF